MALLVTFLGKFSMLLNDFFQSLFSLKDNVSEISFIFLDTFSMWYKISSFRKIHKK